MTVPELLRFNLETARRALGQAENLLTDPDVVAAAAGDSEVGDRVAAIMLSAGLVARNAQVGDPPWWAAPDPAAEQDPLAPGPDGPVPDWGSE
ncbi:MAG TPA: hypothetical protein VIJ82_03795 [Streptosporangiaceae bacterium]